MCFIYRTHIAGSTVAQKSLIPCVSSSLFVGFVFRRIWYFRAAHSLSIGFRSGDSGGVGQWLMPFWLIQFTVDLLVCFGSLSCQNRCPVGYTVETNGFRYSSSMVWYTELVIIPVNMGGKIRVRWTQAGGGYVPFMCYITTSTWRGPLFFRLCMSGWPIWEAKLGSDERKRVGDMSPSCGT